MVRARFRVEGPVSVFTCHVVCHRVTTPSIFSVFAPLGIIVDGEFRRFAEVRRRIGQPQDGPHGAAWSATASSAVMVRCSVTYLPMDYGFPPAITETVAITSWGSVLAIFSHSAAPFLASLANARSARCSWFSAS